MTFIFGSSLSSSIFLLSLNHLGESLFTLGRNHLDYSPPYYQICLRNISFGTVHELSGPSPSKVAQNQILDRTYHFPRHIFFYWCRDILVPHISLQLDVSIASSIPLTPFLTPHERPHVISTAMIASIASRKKPAQVHPLNMVSGKWNVAFLWQQDTLMLLVRKIIVIPVWCFIVIEKHKQVTFH